MQLPFQINSIYKHLELSQEFHMTLFWLKSTLSAFKLKSKFGILPKLMFASACGASIRYILRVTRCIAIRHRPENRIPQPQNQQLL